MTRARVAQVFALMLLCSVAQAGIVSDYEALTGKTADRAIESALDKEPARWKKISIKVRCNVTDDGRLRDVRITSKIPNRWAEETVRRVLLSLRLPPVPKEIVATLGPHGLYFDGEFELSK